jgi:ABC-2 type transport system ATP-binding protein
MPAMRQSAQPTPPFGLPAQPEPQQEPMISLRGVSKRYGDRDVVRNLTFDVMRGEIFGFIGPSGSGKTTTIRLLTGVTTPTEGQVMVLGVPPSSSRRQVQERFGYMPQLFVLYPNLTVRENLRFVAGLYGLGPFQRVRRVEDLITFVELTEAANRPASDISGGMQRRLELAAALLHDPPLLFADEPTAGVDPVLRGRFWDEFRRLRDDGRTIFVTTQYVSESEYCDRVGVIRDGTLLALDTPVALRRTAMGGDVVDVQGADIARQAVQTLWGLTFVNEVSRISAGHVRVYVSDAGPAIPQIVETLNRIGCSVSSIEQYKPNFDEVFVALMNRDDESRSVQQGAS